MQLSQAPDTEAVVHVNNIGGIQEASVQLPPGVSILVGRNATNRTSLLRAIMAGLGSDNVNLKADAEEGEVTLKTGEDTYTRQLVQETDSVRITGSPYKENTEVADLFAFLLESNEARRAVLQSGDLRKVIMSPIDTDELQAEIDRLSTERRKLTQELDEIDELESELSGLKDKLQHLESQIDEKSDDLAAKEKELEAKDVDIEDSRGEQEQLEAEFETLSSKRTALDDVRYDLETERARLEALNRERKKLEEEQDQLPEPSEESVRDIDAKLDRLREQKKALEFEISELQSVIGFNEDIISEGHGDFLSTTSTADKDIVTEGLSDSDEIRCWTCGSDVNTDHIETTIDNLRNLSKEKTSNIRELEEEIDSLSDRKRNLEAQKEERNSIEQRLQEIESGLDEGEATVENLQNKRDSLTEEIETIEERVEEMENETYNAVLELHKEANEIEYELGRLEEEHEQVSDRISSIKSRLADREEIEGRLDEISAEIDELRTQVDRVEEDAVEAFNTHMSNVLARLNYSNLDRIWIEQKKHSVRDGGEKTEQSKFELHVVRTTATGTAYEDTVDHLSESEREVTGLVFALAGYLAHHVYEEVPFMLLDSLEALDAPRIAALINYFKEYAGYLVIALLPEDAQAMDEEFQRITEI